MDPDFSTQEFLGAAVALVAAGIGLAKYIVSRFDRKVDAILKTMERDKAELNARMERYRNEQNAELAQHKAELDARLERDKTELNARMDRHKAELDARLERDKTELNARMDRHQAELNRRMDRDKAELNARIDREKKEILARIAESDARQEQAFAMIVAQLQELHHRSGVLEGLAARPGMAPQPREQVAAQAVPDALEDSNSEDQ